MDDFWKAITIAVAFVAAAVAYNSYLVAREKFRLDLFDRRFKIFDGARRLISAVITTGDVTSTELWEFRAAMIGKEFLLSDSVVAYLNLMDRNAVRAHTFKVAVEQQKGAPLNEGMAKQWQQNQDTYWDAIKWLTEQLQQLHPQFEPDLKIRTKHVF